MKKILFLTALGATMLASCSQDEALETAAEQRHEISFRSSVGSRVGYSDNIARLSNLKWGGFKVSAFRYAGSGESKTVSTDPHFQNLEVQWSSGIWMHDVRYWPTKGEYVSGTTQAEGLDFLAFYPKATEGVTFASGVMTVTDYTPAAAAADQKDVLVAYTADQTETGASAGVPLAFKHALSQIEVKATNSSDLYDIYVKKVEIHNVHGKETMTLGHNKELTWTATDNAISTRAYSSVADSYKLGTTPISFQTYNYQFFMLIPQTTSSWDNENQTTNEAAGAYFVVYAKITNKNTDEYALGIGDDSNCGKLAIPIPANDGENIKWEAGKKYTYTLNFFKDGGGVGYHEPDGSAEAGKSAIPGNVQFSATQTVSDWADGSVEPEAPTGVSNLLPGEFSVSATKKVKFTKGNLYYSSTDSQYHLESAQNVTYATLGQTAYDATHVCHFYWANTTDWQTSGKEPWAETYSYSAQNTGDKFFCGEDNKMTVDGTSGLYTLSGGDGGEWAYLIFSRTNASELYKISVFVTTSAGTSRSLIIAPDDYDYTTNPLQASYTAEEWATAEALGLVCLPHAGIRDGSSLDCVGNLAFYWSATLNADDAEIVRNFQFDWDDVYEYCESKRYRANSLRLVKTVE